MLLTRDQQRKFWREWSAAINAQGWRRTMNAAEIENERYQLLDRAGFASLTEVDHEDGFDRVLKELSILKNDLSGVLRADAMALTRLKFAIRESGETLGSRYLIKLMSDLFKTSDLDSLSEAQLTILHHTLANRTRRKSKQRNAAALANQPF